MKVKQEPITVRELADGYADDGEGGVVGFGGKLDIRPPYQREFVYKEKQREMVIRTVAEKFPLNSMYWAEREDGGFEVIDGQQRTISLCQFVNNDFPIADLFGVKELREFHLLDSAEQAKILDYPLTVYQCAGTDTEKLQWFRVVNIAGAKLEEQELRNAVYSGAWVSDAKRWFSRVNCPAAQYKKYLSGAAIRQKYLETAIRWAALTEECGIEEYMSRHQRDKNAAPLWEHFEKVMDWVREVFPKCKDAIEGVEWGRLHFAHSHKTWDADALKAKIDALMADEEIKEQKGVYEYVLTGDKKHLSLRLFSDPQKKTMYSRQKGKCAAKDCPDSGKEFRLDEMEADHITPWSEGGKTELSNGQMLCKPCNRRKSNK